MREPSPAPSGPTRYRVGQVPPGQQSHAPDAHWHVSAVQQHSAQQHDSPQGQASEARDEYAKADGAARSERARSALFANVFMTLGC